MAGGDHHYHPVRIDPGVESWNYVKENVWQKFRFTNRTARVAFIWGVLVPVGVFAIFERQDLKWDAIGAQRDSPLARFGTYSVPPSERVKPTTEDEE